MGRYTIYVKGVCGNEGGGFSALQNKIKNAFITVPGLPDG